MFSFSEVASPLNCSGAVSVQQNPSYSNGPRDAGRNSGIPLWCNGGPWAKDSPKLTSKVHSQVTLSAPGQLPAGNRPSKRVSSGEPFYLKS